MCIRLDTLQEIKKICESDGKKNIPRQMRTEFKTKAVDKSITSDCYINWIKKKLKNPSDSPLLDTVV